MSMPTRKPGRRSRRATALLPVGLVLVASCYDASALPEPAEITATVMVEEVSEFLRGYASGMNAGDTALLRSLYTPDPRFTWVEDGVLRYESVDAVIAALGQLPSGTELSTTFGDPVITPYPPRSASVRTAFRTSMALPQGAYEFGGMITMVLERQGGEWRIITGHTSTERPREGEGDEW